MSSLHWISSLLTTRFRLVSRIVSPLLLRRMENYTNLPVFPFGVTNGVSAFQRSIDNIVDKEKFSDTFVSVNNVTICGKTPKEYEYNLQRFYDIVKMYNITLNENKSTISTNSITLLIYIYIYINILFITTRSHQTIIDLNPYSKCYRLKILNLKNE